MIRIQTNNLSKRFNREWIFHKLNSEFHTGNTYAITGPNGSGKSTLQQVLWGQMPPSSGELTYSMNNNPIEGDHIYNYVTIAAPYLDLIEEFTLQELLEFHFKSKPIRSGFSIESIIDILYLQDARTKYIMNFSSGMKQRVKLGLAFYTDVPVLFLDEPGANLDRKAFEWYLHHLEQIRHNKLVFIASNQPEEYPESAIKIDLLQFKVKNLQVT
jgi:ABC-type multidrug transport system ATPase subunit